MNSSFTPSLAAFSIMRIMTCIAQCAIKLDFYL